MTIQRLRVPFGFAFALLYLLLARPVFEWWLLGLITACLGLGIRIWAAGHLRKWQQLAVSGPYRFTRNPLYLGSSLMGCGFSIASTRPLLLLLFLILFIGIYVPVMRREEGELLSQYGDRFETYRRQVPLFFPRLPRTSSPTGTGEFNWKTVGANREYNAAIGCLVVGLFLYLRLA